MEMQQGRKATVQILLRLGLDEAHDLDTIARAHKESVQGCLRRLIREESERREETARRSGKEASDG